MRVCSTPGCPNIYPTQQGTRCPTHQLEARRKRYTTNNVYSTKAHKQFRASVLTKNPICVLCNKREATVADHHPHSRRTLQDLGLNPNDPQYGRGLCHTCHNRETATHQPGGWHNPTP